MNTKIETHSKQLGLYPSLDSNQSLNPLISNINIHLSLNNSLQKIIQTIKLQIFLIPFKQPANHQFQVLCINILQNCNLKEVSDYLSTNSKIPFNKYFFSFKPGQKKIISMYKKIKDLKNQCQKYQDSLILICYERQTNKQLQKFLNAQNYKILPKTGQLPQQKANRNENMIRSYKENKSKQKHVKYYQEKSIIDKVLCCLSNKRKQTKDKVIQKNNKI